MRTQLRAAPSNFWLPPAKFKGHHVYMFDGLHNRQETCFGNAQSVCVPPPNVKTRKHKILHVLACHWLPSFFTLTRHLFDGSTANQGRLDNYQGGTVRI